MNKKLILLILLLVLIPSVLGDTFFSRLTSKEKTDNNGICEDAEWFWSSDCNNLNNIFEQTWFIKVVLVGLVVILYIKRKEVDIKKIILIVLLVFLLLNINFSELIPEKGKDINTTTSINKTTLDINHLKDESIKMVNTLNITALGEGFIPSHPNLSWLVFFIVAFIFITLIINGYDFISDRIGGR